MSIQQDMQSVAEQFELSAALRRWQPLVGGHIHDSYLLTCGGAGESERYLLQQINDAVFADPLRLMDNIQRVTSHIRGQLAAAGAADINRRVLTLVPTRGGGTCWRDQAGRWWRVYRYIEGTRTHEVTADPERAYQAGRAFGAFQSLLSTLPPPPLHETIPDFHHTARRVAALESAVCADPCRRAADTEDEIHVAFQHQALGDGLAALQRRELLPQRVAHHDAKLSNVLFDEATGRGLCVVDLDTVMPGLALYDFGDMVRSMACPLGEDEPDTAKIAIHKPLFEALTRGYLQEAQAFLLPAEKAHLVLAARVITYEQGVRFLTDFLQGDHYYKTSHPTHNLQRCRCQFKLLDALTRQEPELERIVSRF